MDCKGQNTLFNLLEEDNDDDDAVFSFWLNNAKRGRKFTKQIEMGETVRAAAVEKAG